MKVRDSVAFVSGANRGVGRAYVDSLIAHGAAKVYVGTRNVEACGDLVRRYGEKVEPVQLDLLDPDQIVTATQKCRDVNLLINNAGFNQWTPFLATSEPAAAELEIRTNYLGPLEMCRAFRSVLTAKQDAAVVNMISILAKVCLPSMGSLCASKAAALSMTEGVRAELRGERVLVVAVLPGVIDTSMMADFPDPKANPVDVVEAVLAGLERGDETIYPDAMSQELVRRLGSDPDALRAEFEQSVAGVS